MIYIYIYIHIHIQTILEQTKPGSATAAKRIFLVCVNLAMEVVTHPDLEDATARGVT